MEPIGTTFVTAMKMLIGPIVFLTIVGGIASVADLKKVGFTGFKALTYFQVGTILAMIFGLVAINIFRVGDGVNADPGKIETSESRAEADHQRRDQAVVGVHHPLVPTAWSGPFVEGDILQIIFMAVLFGVALNAVGHIGGPVLDLINRVTQIVFKILNYIMKLAPLGAFGAMAYAIGKYGVSTLTSLGVADRAVLRDLRTLRLRGPRLGHGLPAAQHLAHAQVPARGAAADPGHLDRRAGTARLDAQDGVRRRAASPPSGSSYPPGTASTSTVPRSTSPWRRSTSPRPPTPTSRSASRSACSR